MVRQDVSAGLPWHRRGSNTSAELGPVNSVSFDPSPMSSSSQGVSRVVGTDLSRSEKSPLPSSFPTRIAQQSPLETESGSHERAATDSIRSLSSIASGHPNGPTKEAVLDSRVIVNVVNGVVASGTLEGLVDRLITNFSELVVPLKYIC